MLADIKTIIKSHCNLNIRNGTVKENREFAAEMYAPVFLCKKLQIINQNVLSKEALQDKNKGKMIGNTSFIQY